MLAIFLFIFAINSNLAPKEDIACTDYYCETCDTPDNCLKCQKGYGFKKDNGKNVCSKCVVDSCSECYENYVICKSCSDGPLLSNGRCQKCQKGYGFLNGKCIPEPTNCNEYKVQGDTFVCESNGCIPGYFPSTIDSVCTPCSTENCLYCDAPMDVCYTCEDGYSKFTENGIKYCKKCEKENCRRCNDDVTICTDCNQGYGLVIDENDENKGGCHICDENCRDCSDNYLICTECISGYYGIDNDGKCLPCLEGCKDNNCNVTFCNNCYDGYGLVLDESGEITGKCKECQEYCKSCQSDASNCDQCDYHSVMIGTTEKKCVLLPKYSSISENKVSCYYGFGILNDKDGNPTQICEPCPPNCINCDENSNFCIECKSNYGPVLDKNGQKTGICEKCTGFCSHCEDDYSKCSECGYFEDFSDYLGKEIDENGKFTGNCLPCAEFCDECTENAKICTDCKYGYRLILDDNGESTGKCGKCSVQFCDYCDEDPDFCEECDYGYDVAVDSEGKKTGKCQKCPENCYSCSKEPNKCDEGGCERNSGPVLDENGDFTGKCELCGENCQYCRSNYKICTDCFYEYHHVLGPDGQPTADCAKCPDNCTNCDEDVKKCSQCINGYGKVYGPNNETITCAKCQSDDCSDCSEDYRICEQCNYKTFLEMDENGFPTGKCISCGKNCSSCTPDGKYCIECRIGYSLDDSSNADCVKCDERCSKCSMSDKNLCLECNVGYAKIYENNKFKGDCRKCIDNCKYCNDETTCNYCVDGFGLNEEKTCSKCKDANCKYCSYDYTKCSTCNDDFHLINGNCLSCPENCMDCSYDINKCSLCNSEYGLEYNDKGERTGKCSKCGENCRSCILNSKVCESCENGFGHEYDSNGALTGNCKKCPENCQNCISNADQCLMCNESFGLILNQDGKSTGKCGSCPEHCRFCDFDNSICTGCELGFALVTTESDGKKVGQCTACPENCQICDSKTLFCYKCGQKDDDSYGFEVGSDGTILNTCAKCPSNCYYCITSNTCIECDDGYDEVIGSDNLVKCVSSSGEDVTPVECLVDGCEICEEGLSDQCAKCNSSLVLTPDKQCSNLLDDITAPPTPISKPVTPDYDSVENGNLNCDFDKEDLGDSEQFLLKIEEEQNIESITIKNKNNANITIEIPEGYEEITFKVDENTENKAFDIIPPSSSSVTIKLDPATQASIVEAAGEISLESTEQDKSVNINQIKPNSDLTITPKSSIKINDIEFGKKNTNIIINSDDNEKVQINSIKVQQLKTGTIQNATIKGNIIMGLSSSLEINKYVKLDDSTLNISYNEEYSQLIEDTAQIKGTINSTPKKIFISTRIQNEWLSSNKILVAESKEKFDCKSWGDRIEYIKPFNAYECDEQGPYRLYVTQKVDDGGKGKDKLPPGAIAGIVIAVVVVVGLVIFLLVYFLVIKKRNISMSSKEGGEDNSVDI